MADETKPLLIVDADRKSRRILEISLHKAGLACLSAQTAHEALEILAQQAVALIISDTDLPEVDGFDLCRKIKSDPRTEPIPFIFLTHSRDMAHKLRGYELGVDEYLTKPAYVREIIGRIQFLLRRQRQEVLAEAEAQTVSGELDDITLIDILQTIEDTRKTGALRLTTKEHWGTIYFSEGRIMDARSGLLLGSEAFFRLITWTGGSYTIKYLPTLHRHRRIQQPLDDLLLEGFNRQEQWEAIIQELASIDLVLRIHHDRLAQTIGELTEADREIIHLFDGRRTIHQVIMDSQLGDLATLAVIQHLAQRGLLEPGKPARMEPDDFDELAAEPPSDPLSPWNLGHTQPKTPATPFFDREREEEEARLRQELEELRKLRETEEQTWLEAQAQKQASEARTAELSVREREILNDLGEEAMAGESFDLSPLLADPAVRVSSVDTMPASSRPPATQPGSAFQPQAADSEVERVLRAVHGELKEIQRVIQTDRKALDEIRQLTELQQRLLTEPDRWTRIKNEVQSFERVGTSPKHRPVFPTPAEEVVDEPRPRKHQTADYPAVPFINEDQSLQETPAITSAPVKEDAPAIMNLPPATVNASAFPPIRPRTSTTLVGFAAPGARTPAEGGPRSSPTPDASGTTAGQVPAATAAPATSADPRQEMDELLQRLDQERQNLMQQHKKLLEEIEQERNLLDHERRKLHSELEDQRRATQEERELLLSEVARTRLDLEKEREFQNEFEVTQQRLKEERLLLFEELDRARLRQEEAEVRHRSELAEQQRRADEDIAREKQHRQAREERWSQSRQEIPAEPGKPAAPTAAESTGPSTADRSTATLTSQENQPAQSDGTPGSTSTLSLQWTKLKRTGAAEQRVATTAPRAMRLQPVRGSLATSSSQHALGSGTSEASSLQRRVPPPVPQESQPATSAQDEQLAAGIHAALFPDLRREMIGDLPKVQREPEHPEQAPVTAQSPETSPRQASARPEKVLDSGEELRFKEFFKPESEALDELMLSEEQRRLRQKRIVITVGIMALIALIVLLLFSGVGRRTDEAREEAATQPPAGGSSEREQAHPAQIADVQPSSPAVTPDRLQGTAIEAFHEAVDLARTALAGTSVVGEPLPDEASLSITQSRPAGEASLPAPAETVGTTGSETVGTPEVQGALSPREAERQSDEEARPTPAVIPPPAESEPARQRREDEARRQETEETRRLEAVEAQRLEAAEARRQENEAVRQQEAAEARRLEAEEARRLEAAEARRQEEAQTQEGEPEATREAPASVTEEVEVDTAQALQQARRYMDEEEFPQAAAELRQLLEVAPNNRTANRLMGLTLYEMAQTREAIRFLERGTSGNRPEETALCILGNAREEVGDNSGAEQTYRRYLELYPDGPCASYARNQVGE